MQKKGKQTKPVEMVRKPIVPGSWHGADARKLAFKRFLGLIGITLIYLLAGSMLSFENVWASVGVSLVIVFLVASYQYASGMNQGQSDATYGEILYGREENGHEVDAKSRERSFHPAKGFFAVLLGCLPFVVFAIVYACIAKKAVYRLGVLPTWTDTLMGQTEFSTALSYYNAQTGVAAADVMRIIDRAMIMPFVNVSTSISADCTLLMERLSPLLILVAPIWYGVGYTQGRKQRDRINTGIKMGDERKKRRERKARRQRQQSKTPERLI